jgi:hypothetical protein
VFEKRIPVIALLAAAALPAAASDWHLFVAQSDRSANAMIMELLAESETAVQLDIVSALGERDDPYVEDIIRWIHEGFDSRTVFRREFVLRTLLGSLLDSSLPSDVLAERAAANLDGLERLIREMGEIRDPLLRNELIRIMDLLSVDLTPCISRQFVAVLCEVKVGGGETGPENRALLLSLLSFAARHPRVEFLQPCLEAARASRESLVVENARAAAKIIVESMR